MTASVCHELASAYCFATLWQGFVIGACFMGLAVLGFRVPRWWLSSRSAEMTSPLAIPSSEISNS